MKICYFGIYDSGVGRNKVYISGLRGLGHEVLECRDSSSGIKKYFALWRKHQAIGKYDAIIVGCPSHVVVWFAKLLSPKPIVFDAGWTMEEGVVVSRGEKGFWGLKSWYIRLVDRFAVLCSDAVLVESNEQKKYFISKFGQPKKYEVVYSGADEDTFFLDNDIKKETVFTAVFRGKFLPEAGVTHILDAAKILQDKDVNFLIMGRGWLEKEIKSKLASLNLKNLSLISEYLSDKDKRQKMLKCHVSLGQFEEHDRLKRTIPHKCFESIALALPYVTTRTNPVKEILSDQESCMFVEAANPQDLADKILHLKNSPELSSKIGLAGRKIFEEKLSSQILAGHIIALIRKLK